MLLRAYNILEIFMYMYMHLHIRVRTHIHTNTFFLNIGMMYLLASRMNERQRQQFHISCKMHRKQSKPVIEPA